MDTVSDYSGVNLGLAYKAATGRLNSVPIKPNNDNRTKLNSNRGRCNSHIQLFIGRQAPVTIAFAVDLAVGSFEKLCFPELLRKKKELIWLKCLRCFGSRASFVIPEIFGDTAVLLLSNISSPRKCVSPRDKSDKMYCDFLGPLGCNNKYILKDRFHWVHKNYW